ncbi:hypothetical protein ES703_25437 [subsurface metagenome]
MRYFVNILLRIKRWIVQLISLFLWNSLFFPQLKVLPCPGLNCYGCPFAVFACPIGTLQHFVIIRQLPFYTIGILGIIGSFFGRMSCGWLCPFGFLQDILHKIKVPKLRFSNRFSWLRYAVLIILVVIIPYLTLEPWFSKLCPVGTIEAGIPWLILQPPLRELIGWLFGLKILILIFFLVWSIVTSRPFCRFICPLGAIYSIFNKISAFQFKIDEEVCIKCEKCNQVCPMKIDVLKGSQQSQCIRCMECVKACPKDAIKI